MNLADIVFAVIIIVTMAGALTTVVSGSIIYALMGLVTTMFGIAGLYIYLNAPFLSMMQILIYVGAISILIAFAVMLAGPLYRKPKEWTTVTKFIAALVVSLFSFFFFLRVVVGAFLQPEKVSPFNVSTKDIGRMLFDRLAFPFELISLLIVVSIVGAVMLALFAKGEK
jgi:NADH:ubiquinone oxidoreductase subunit 6 (subunit J)